MWRRSAPERARAGTQGGWGKEKALIGKFRTNQPCGRSGTSGSRLASLACSPPPVHSDQGKANVRQRRTSGQAEGGGLVTLSSGSGSSGRTVHRPVSVVGMIAKLLRDLRGRTWARATAAVLVVVVTACTETPLEEGAIPTHGSASASATSSASPGPGSSSSPSPTPDTPAEGGAPSLRLIPPPGGSFLVRGRYPSVATRCKDAEPLTLTGRFPGALRVRRSDDGTLALTVVVPFDRYLEGIAEVPSSWPRAALEAQAIAARSYALATTGWSGDEGEALDEPICATTSCQVYRGIPVPADPDHGRWVRAVRRTDGKVLLHDGGLATTVYFSTSNGRTYPNEEVFGSEPLPYLRSVPERDDGASPTSRWRVRLPFNDLTRFLRAADMWPSGRGISIVRPHGASLSVEAEVRSGRSMLATSATPSTRGHPACGPADTRPRARRGPCPSRSHPGGCTCPPPRTHWW